MTGNLNLETSWGPFSPTYLGISHILDAGRGFVADMPLFVARREPASVILPESTFDYVQGIEDGSRRATVLAVPEEVSADYGGYGLRYYLDPHGDTALARFSVEGARRMRCAITFHNTSGQTREYQYGLGLTAADPRKKVRLNEALRPWWVAARDYTAIEAYQKAFGLGCRQCLTRVFSWGVEDEVLAQAFGGWAGDRVTYRTTLPRALEDGFLYFRFVKYGTSSPAWELRVNGKATTFRFPQTWALPGGGWGKNRDAYEEWRLLRIPIGRIAEPGMTIELRSLDAPGNDLSRIWLDGMLFSEGRLPGDEGEEALVHPGLIEELSRQGAAVKLESSSETSASFAVLLPDAPEYGATVRPEEAALRARTGTGSFLADLRHRYGLPPVRLEKDSLSSPWGMLESGPIAVPPRSSKTVSFTVSFDPEAGVAPTASPAEIPSEEAHKGPDRPPDKGPYAEMTSRLRDLLLFNINYPLPLFGAPSAYFVPAKYFPVPYSWDGGLTAVGLATFAPGLALRQAAYFFADEHLDFPHLYAGSPVPTPLYALWEAYQATQDRGALCDAYPGAKRMYDFYLGRTPGSVVNAHGDGLLSTYAYNYNLGIDDHPIQRWAEEHGLTSKGLYSIILMPQILRMAGIMRNIATLLGREADAALFSKDAELLGARIEDGMWDEESGLYGWLCRDGDRVKPVVMDGCAGDRTACAFLPLFAGLTRHKERLIPQMMDPARFRTPHGISSVDMTAPSYNPKGYWNGGIWPVMQWYLWRGLLEAGEPVLARSVADVILRTWQNVWEKEHYLGEHFMIESGQMNGAPNFGGLSAVLLPMSAAYYRPYQVTACYDIVILEQAANRELDTLRLELSAPFSPAASHELLVNMGKASTLYAATVNGEPGGEFFSDAHGHLSLRLPRPSNVDRVTVEPAERGSR